MTGCGTKILPIVYQELYSERFCWLLLARDTIYAVASYMLSPVRPLVLIVNVALIKFSLNKVLVRLSACLPHGWISKRRLKLASRNPNHK